MHLKERLFLPILFCEKNIGPLELSFISKEIIINNGRKKTKNNKEKSKSNSFLKNL
tara:strand:+ start:168 stop:335 length:168 start_codon:yes stop_codon:yes gene_type:complete